MQKTSLIILAISLMAVGGCGDEDDGGLISHTASSCDFDCGVGELCVVTYDGTCGQISAECVATSCTLSLQCSQECDDELCPEPTTCMAPGCQAELAEDFSCYGP